MDGVHHRSGVGETVHGYHDGPGAQVEGTYERKEGGTVFPTL